MGAQGHNDANQMHGNKQRIRNVESDKLKHILPSVAAFRFFKHSPPSFFHYYAKGTHWWCIWMYLKYLSYSYFRKKRTVVWTWIKNLVLVSKFEEDSKLKPLLLKKIPKFLMQGGVQYEKLQK